MGYGYGWGCGRGRGWGRGGGGGPPWSELVGRLPRVEPPPPGVLRVAAGVEYDAGLDSLVSPRFARAPYIALVDTYGGRVTGLRCLANPLASAGQGVGMALAQWLASVGVRVVLAAWLGPGAAQALETAGIRVVQVQPGMRLRDALRLVGVYC